MRSDGRPRPSITPFRVARNAPARQGGHFADRLGKGPLLAIPVNWESYNLAYLPEILAEAGVDVPQTWPDYFAAARAIAQRVPGARGFGDIDRFVVRA